MKDIKGYEGLYAITSCGKVWSYKSNRFLKATNNGNGYLKVTLVKNGQRKCFFVHRLVAEAYIDNPMQLPQINHKDENKNHNWINNLEWCDSVYNNNYGSHTEKISKKVYCIELDRNFKSYAEAGRVLGIDCSHIGDCCRGKREICGGYHWRFIYE